MAQPNNKRISFSRFLTILILMLLIYLLCTDFMYMDYNGAFATVIECETYTEDNGIISFENLKSEDNPAVCGVIFEAVTDADEADFSFSLDNSEEASNIYLNIQNTKYSGAKEDSDNYDGLSYKATSIKSKDEIKLFLLDDSEKKYLLSGSVSYNPAVFKAKYVYDTNSHTLAAYSAFDLLFGSRSMENMNFSGNLWALFFWLPPVIALGFYIFDSKSYTKNMVAMAMSVVSIFAVVYFVGGARLATGSMLTIVINLVLFILALFPILSRKDN